jgi:uncharacterized DUF497 family protein
LSERANWLSGKVVLYFRIRWHFSADYALKDRENQQKHGVSFGQVSGGVLTVRFTRRGETVRIIGRATGEKEG